MTTESFDYQEVFNRYIETKTLVKANMFHLYDTGKECIIDRGGYYDSRHFRLVAYNIITMQKRDFGIHDGLSFDEASLAKRNIQLSIVRVFADGSFFLQFNKLLQIINGQTVFLK